MRARKRLLWLCLLPSGSASTKEAGATELSVPMADATGVLGVAARLAESAEASVLLQTCVDVTTAAKEYAE
jgi:hypothetical protein